MRAGPPLVLKPFDKVMNLTEYFVHHEDVRRGAGDNTARTDAEGARIEDALWQMLHRSAKFMTRPVKAIGLDLLRPDGDVIHVRPGPAVATITGPPARSSSFSPGATPPRRCSAAVTPGPCRHWAPPDSACSRFPPTTPPRGTKTPGRGRRCPRLRRRGGPDRDEHRPRTRR